MAVLWIRECALEEGEEGENGRDEHVEEEGNEFDDVVDEGVGDHGGGATVWQCC